MRTSIEHVFLDIASVELHPEAAKLEYTCALLQKSRIHDSLKSLCLRIENESSN